MQCIKRRMIPLALSAIMALSSQVYAKATPIDIVAQPLASALTQFAEQAHVQVLVSQELVSGKIAPEVRGELEPIDALKALLKNSGLEAVSQNGTLVIKKVEKAQEESLETITMTGEVKPEEGSAEAGYKVDTVKNIGPWGERSLQDTPYSINIASADLLQNLQISQQSDFFRLNPTTQPWTTSTRAGGANSNVMMRGFSQPNTGGKEEDGMRTLAMTTGLEDKENVETLTGLSGFLYGAENVGGTINYVLKRPTLSPLADVTVGNYGGSNHYAHGDFGGAIDQDKKLAYRVNLVAQDGNTAIDDQTQKRYLASGAIDWHVTNDLLIQLDSAYNYWKMEGSAPYWSFSGTATHPFAPDSSKDWGEKYSLYEVWSNKEALRLKWNLNDIFTVRVAYSLANYTQGDQIYVNNEVTNNSGSYSQSISKLSPIKFDTDAAYTYLDSKFSTGNINHKMTVGFFTDNYTQKAASNLSTSQTFSGFSFADPVSITEPTFASVGGDYITRNKIENMNLVIGDDVQFNDAWSLLVGATNSNEIVKSYNSTTGILASSYDKSKITPSVSLMYKPIHNVTTYVSYMESLEQGAIVGNTYKNAREILEPLASEQYEIGAKTDINGLLLTSALFQIDKANQYSNDGTTTGTYVQDGRQVHKGLEVTVSGKATENLSLFGGATWMNARVEKSNTSDLEGKIPTNVAEKMAKMYAEYDLPIHGLTLTGGVYYMGEMYANTTNTDKLPAVITEDLGARYTTKFDGYKTILRLNITNITDKHYWLDSTYTGIPRTVALSATVKF